MPRKAVAVIRVTRSPIALLTQRLLEGLDLIATRSDRLQEALLETVRQLREASKHLCQEVINTNPLHRHPPSLS